MTYLCVGICVSLLDVPLKRVSKVWRHQQICKKPPKSPEKNHYFWYVFKKKFRKYIKHQIFREYSIIFFIFPDNMRALLLSRKLSENYQKIHISTNSKKISIILSRYSFLENYQKTKKKRFKKKKVLTLTRILRQFAK